MRISGTNIRVAHKRTGPRGPAYTPPHFPKFNAGSGTSKHGSGASTSSSQSASVVMSGQHTRIPPGLSTPAKSVSAADSSSIASVIPSLVTSTGPPRQEATPVSHGASPEVLASSQGPASVLPQQIPASMLPGYPYGMHPMNSLNPYIGGALTPQGAPMMYGGYMPYYAPYNNMMFDMFTPPMAPPPFFSGTPKDADKEEVKDTPTEAKGDHQQT